MNLANVLTGGFAKDIEIDQNTVNLGNQMMFLSIVVLEMLSNLILQRSREFLPLLYLPGSPDNPQLLVSKGLVRFTEDEATLLQKRLEYDDSEKKGGSQGLQIPLRLVWKTILYYRRWPHFISTACAFSTWSPLTTYSPSIIM
ncbi:hypothetical protein GX50_03282 [[Emmonsia] crescens]|uniref:Uncharacterized protein n=1 Tax=[Emmonsia] crescens TaxID=73230 RepID=A0A2B7ZLK4_9EURO|nr:hypothetical protein GX50_03282 [Emmonsia crescens]